MPGIFVCYRREPTAAWAGRIADRLRDYFGRRRVFIDVADIKPGAVFPRVVESRIKNADAFVVVIGPQWTTLIGQDGKPRLFQDNDWVRKEVAMALGSSVPVIPVLVDDAVMPGSLELPTDIRALAERHAIDLSPSSFDSDVPRLIEALKERGANRTLGKRIGRRGMIGISVAVTVVGLLLTLWILDWVRESSLRREATGEVALIAGLMWERFEVSNERYKACVDAGVCDEPGRARNGERYDEFDRSNLPVVAVRADQAVNFCAWIGRRLPSLSEWRTAATGDGTRWPWGDEDPDVNRVNAVFVLKSRDAGTGVDPALEDRIEDLAKKDSVTTEELEAIVPNVGSQELTQWVEDWLRLTRDERAERLAQAVGDQSPTIDQAIIPDDVVAVDGNPLGATSAKGVHHLIGNAAEWSSTTGEGATWEGEAATELWAVGGSFGTDIESLADGLLVRSDEALDTVGFRCVEERQGDE